MRRLAVLSVFAILLLVFGCAGGRDDDSQVKNPSSAQNAEESQQSAQANAPEQELKKKLEKEPKEEPAPINLSGSGPTATDPFNLESGLAIFRMSYQGDRNFIVNLLDGSGTPPAGALLANELGAFEGSQAEQTEAGQHILDVKASGPWTITIEQPRPTSAPQTIDYTYTTGQTATDFFELSKGLKRFTLAHDGKRNFTVWLLDKDGEKVPSGLLANEIGPFEGSTAVQVPRDDIYLLQVEADGLWRVEGEGLNLAGR